MPRVTSVKGKDPKEHRARVKKARKAKRTKARNKVKSEKEMLKALKLPIRKKKIVLDFRKYTMLLYGRAKIGKTQWLADWEDVLFAATEPGTHGQEIFEFNDENGGVKNWKIMRRMVDLLEAQPDKYKNVVIDTAEEAFNQCIDYVCKKLGIEHPGVDAFGENDWGKSWKAVKKEFTSIFHRIIQSGRGLYLVSHAREREINPRDGQKYHIIEPTLSGSASSVIIPLIDCIFFADYMKDEDGKTVRVVVTEGDDTIVAGHRSGEFPRFFAPPKHGAAEVFKNAFLGVEEGLDPRSLKPAKKSSKAGKAFVKKAKREKIAKDRRRKKKRRKEG